MSPVSLSSAITATGPTIQTGSSLILPDAWNNRLPTYFRDFEEIDNRKHYLQAENNQWLELHPKGTRGVEDRTKFCVLLLFIHTLIPSNSHSKIELTRDKKTSLGKPIEWDHPKFIIQGNETKNYLCMDNKSVVYQSAKFSEVECVFQLEPDPTLQKMDRFYRQLNSSMPKWYVAINKDGTIRCGNVTKSRYPGAKFSRNDVNTNTSKLSSPPPFKKQKADCCKKKRCKNKKRDKPKKRKDPKCQIQKKDQCKKWRRKFFELSLKDLKKYYRNCVQVRRVRHCKNKKKRRSKES